jgi:predicted XRE-type DNA-binding protein
MIKPVPGFEKRYLITENGDIISTNYKCTGKNKTLKQNVSYNGYACIGLFDGKKQRQFRISRLVATVFIGPPPTLIHQVNHKDGNKKNNYYKNLEWCTYYENHNHAITNNLRINICEKHGNAKLNNKQVIAIKRMLKEDNITQRKIAEKFNVHYSCINHIARNRQWKNIKG